MIAKKRCLHCGGNIPSGRYVLCSDRCVDARYNGEPSVGEQEELPLFKTTSEGGICQRLNEIKYLKSPKKSVLKDT